MFKVKLGSKINHNAYNAIVYMCSEAETSVFVASKMTECSHGIGYKHFCSFSELLFEIHHTLDLLLVQRVVDRAKFLTTGYWDEPLEIRHFAETKFSLRKYRSTYSMSIAPPAGIRRCYNVDILFKIPR